MPESQKETREEIAKTQQLSQTILGEVHMFYEMWCIQKLQDRGLKKDWLIFIKVAVVA